MIKIRPEQNALMIWNRSLARTAILSGQEMQILDKWAVKREESGFIRRLREAGLLPENNPEQLRLVVQEARQKQSPLRSFCAPESLHIELTGRCPLQCPQCYKERDTADLSPELLQTIIQQAAGASVFQIALGGGEPLLYPSLPDVIREISLQEMGVTLTTSGTGLNQNVLNQLIHAGIDHIQVSLNGSTEQINQRSRDGFQQACRALTLLSATSLSFGINWVARRDNVDDFPALVRLAEKYRVSNINVLRYKPGPAETYNHHCLTSEKQLLLLRMMRNTKGVRVKTDSAYSSLLCSLNQQAGLFTGCGAGRRFMAVDAHGYFRPCSHVPHQEKATQLMEYWYHSAHLSTFRQIEDRITDPCKSCTFLHGCRGCRALVPDTENNFLQGEPGCVFYRSQD